MDVTVRFHGFVSTLVWLPAFFCLFAFILSVSYYCIYPIDLFFLQRPPLCPLNQYFHSNLIGSPYCSALLSRCETLLFLGIWMNGIKVDISFNLGWKDGTVSQSHIHKHNCTSQIILCEVFHFSVYFNSYMQKVSRDDGNLLSITFQPNFVLHLDKKKTNFFSGPQVFSATWLHQVFRNGNNKTNKREQNYISQSCFNILRSKYLRIKQFERKRNKNEQVLIRFLLFFPYL